MAITHVNVIEVHSRFDALCESLSKGCTCEIGDFIVHNIRTCSADHHSFDADVTNPEGITVQAQVRIALSPHENLLGNKVDVSFMGPKINSSFAEQNFNIL